MGIYGDERLPAGPEIFIGLAGAVGTNVDAVSDITVAALRRVGYHCETVRLSEFFDEIDPESMEDWSGELDDSTHDAHLTTRMTAGDKFRKVLQRGDALALFSLLKIRALRRELEGRGVRRRAYLLRSLKHPDEVETLREVYGANFYLVSAYSPEDTRVDYLAKKIARGHLSEDQARFKADAINLVARDRLEEGLPLGQQLRDTFPMADLFVDARIPNGKTEDLERAIARFVEIIFGHPYRTPKQDEHAMFHAQAAGVRSAALGRQVGATVTNKRGELLAVGCNEVPKAFGGQYWEGDSNDNRDFLRETDDNVEMKTLVAEQILDRLKGAEGSKGWLKSDDVTTNEFIDLIAGTRARSLIEFERAVHAEMAAMLDAGRRGQTVDGATLYSTTFPCHECTRHIIGAGITRVVYIEPYAKSLASQLHDDAIVIDSDDPPEDKVRFEPFVGVAPRRYLELFLVDERRAPDGARFPSQPMSLPKALRPPIEMPPEDEEEEAPAVCPSCGAENPRSGAFCSACGKSLVNTGERTKMQGNQEGRSVGAPTNPEQDDGKTVLSDPAIRFQELLKVSLFRSLLDEKRVRLKEGG
jgi:deoxycytidylate deaminase